MHVSRHALMENGFRVTGCPAQAVFCGRQHYPHARGGKRTVDEVLI